MFLDPLHRHFWIYLYSIYRDTCPSWTSSHLSTSQHTTSKNVFFNVCTQWWSAGFLSFLCMLLRVLRITLECVWRRSLELSVEVNTKGLEALWTVIAKCPSGYLAVHGAYTAKTLPQEQDLSLVCRSAEISHSISWSPTSRLGT